MTKEQRETFDAALGAIDVVRAPDDMSPTPTGRPRKVPAWWKGDAGATDSNLTAARQFGYNVGAVT